MEKLEKIRETRPIDKHAKVWLPTEKQGKPPRDAARPLEIKSLGPRFAALMPKLKPHPVSGVYFRANDRKQTAIGEAYALRLFKRALTVIRRKDFTLHDLRGSWTMHRAMVVDSFRQLQAELGHSDPHAVQSYLDRAHQFDRRESIFYEAPTTSMIQDPHRPGTPEPEPLVPGAVDTDLPSPPPLLH